MSLVRKSLFAAVFFSATALSSIVSAETLPGALAKAYQYNSTLNSSRAGVRVTDENVPLAKSGYRPTIAGVGSIDYSSNNGPNSTTNITTGSFGVQINQMLFDGFQTKNNVAAAQAQVSAAVESLRNDEQNTLFNAVSAYMDVIRDRQIAVLIERNLQFLTEQVRAAQSRFDVGEGTRTDVAQADASRSQAEAQLAAARAQVVTSSAVYRQVIGDDPGKLAPGAAIAKMLPKSLDQAIALAAIDHPAILAGGFLVDAAAFSVKSTEGQLLPQLSASAGVSSNYRNTATGLPGVGSSSDGTTNSASIGASLTIPIYTGGRVSAQVRQSKESLGQARIQVDVSRDQVRAAVTSAWGQYVSATENVSSIRELIAANQLALNGVIEERNVGQRTTLDVLNAQADVINAQISLAGTERDVVVASYAIVSAIGRLTARQLALQVTLHDPKEHYDAVKDKWIGLRTPDGR